MRIGRIADEAQYAIDTRFTVRKIAKVFGVSKSTVWRDMTVMLPKLDRNLAVSVSEVLKENKAASAKRGAEARWRKRK